MKQWIRWSGLFGFLVVVGLLTAFFMFAAGPLIKSSIEHFGSQAAGAKVTVDDVSLTLSPLGVVLDKLQVADADKPMENLIEFDQAVAQLELAPLLLSKGIVRDLTVANLQFNTPRSESGALESTHANDEAEQAHAEKSATTETTAADKVAAQLPSVNDILAREPLQTEAAGKKVQASFASSKKAIEQARAAIPDHQALARYEAEVKALLSSDIKSVEDFQQRKQKFDALKKQFNQDKEAIAQARQVIAQSRKQLTADLSALKSAPAQDLKNIQEKYQFNSQGAANVSALLFGEEAGEWAKKALYWYEKIKPYLSSNSESTSQETVAEVEHQRAQGRFIHFPSNDPWPEFLIRKAFMSAPGLGGFLEISAYDITHQQDVLQRPLHAVVQGSQLTDIEDLNMDISLDHRTGINRDNLTLTVKDWAVRDVDLGVTGSQLDSALIQVQGLALVDSGKLQAQADAQVSQARFSGDGKTMVAKEMNLALAKINQFDINGSAKGDITSPQVKLGSDLDKRLSVAFKERLNDKQQELENKLKAKLNDKVQAYLGDYAKDLQQLNELDGSLDQKTAKLQQMANSQLQDFEAQQKAKAKKKLEEEKRKAEKKAEDKVKEKLKSFF